MNLIKRKENRFDSLINKLQDENLSEEEIKSMPGRIALILEDTITSKIKDTLEYPIDTVELISKPSPNINAGSTEKIKVSHIIRNKEGREIDKNEQTYIEDEIIPYEKKIPFLGIIMDRECTFNEDIAMVIYQWRRMGELDEQQKNGDKIDINKIRRECIRALKEGKGFDEKQLQTDNKGNISTVKPVVKDIDYGER